MIEGKQSFLAEVSKSRTLRLLIVDDHPIIISACRALLSEEDDLEITEAHTVAAAKTAIEQDKPHIVVLDINLPDGSGLALVREVCAQEASPQIIIFSVVDAPMIALQTIQCGARGFISKAGDGVQLRDAIRTVASGRVWLSEELAQELAFIKVRGKPSEELLSNREQEIMRNLARGHNFQQIAKSITVSYWTVVKECENLKSKLNARSASELIRIAVELKLV
ncbi:MAG: response regulator transcription factor [Proteobacteria bacterium]|nr:response regulator transcription factor [Pseudomonadota bacterium]